jgi:hypothetical protein
MTEEAKSRINNKSININPGMMTIASEQDENN